MATFSELTKQWRALVKLRLEMRELSRRRKSFWLLPKSNSPLQDDLQTMLLLWRERAKTLLSNTNDIAGPEYNRMIATVECATDLQEVIARHSPTDQPLS